MVIRIKPNFTTGRAKPGQQMSALEKWKTDWFHEISDLFQVTTDQLGHCYSTIPTLEKTRAIESKAKLSIVLSLIERYFRGQLTVTSKYLKPANSNANNSYNLVASHKKQNVRFMPWTMVNPKEVCPVDYVHQARNPVKQTWKVEEAIDILTASDLADDNLISYDGGSSDGQQSSDDITSIGIRAKHNKSNNTILLVLQPSNKVGVSGKRKHGSEDIKPTEKQSHEKMEFALNQKLVHSTREHELSYIEKLKIETQNDNVAPYVARRKNERSASAEGAVKFNSKYRMKIENQSEVKRFRCLSQQPKVLKSKENHSPNVNEHFKDCDDGLMKLDDIFDLNGEDDVMLASNGLREASFDVQTSLSSLFPSCGLDTQMGNEIDQVKGVLEASDVVNRPAKRKYNKQPKQDPVIMDGENKFPKPTLPYNQLIYLSFKGNYFVSLTVRQIYKFITAYFPYYKTASQTWQNAVRHQLCCCKDYIKITNPISQQGEKPSKYAWKIKDDDSIKKLDAEMIAHLSKGKDLKGIQNAMKNNDMFDDIFADILPHLNDASTENDMD